MRWVAVDKGGGEYIYSHKPVRRKLHKIWDVPSPYSSLQKHISIPKGSIKKLIGRNLTWEDEPVKLK